MKAKHQTNFLANLLILSIVLLPSIILSDDLTVDTSDRTAVIDFYHNHYCPGDNTTSNWNGDIGSGDEGAVSSAYRAVTLERINYFRAMAGVAANITFRSEWNAKCQKAALMMSANDSLDHFPPMTWTHYSADGAEAAGTSNLSLARTGPQSITGQMEDAGASNFAAGHRRWLIFREATQMGFGGVDPRDSFRPASAVWVIQDSPDTSAPDKAVAWPPAGFVPYTLVFDRWSLSYPGADFTGATVTVTKGGTAIPVTVEANTDGFGDNTIVWTIDDSDEGKGGADVSYLVTITGVTGTGVPSMFSYTVTQIDAEPSGAQTIAIEAGNKVDPDTGIIKIYVKARNSAGCFIPGDKSIQLLFSFDSETSGFSTTSEASAGGAVQYDVATVGYYKAKIKGTSIESNVVRIKSNGNVTGGVDNDDGSGTDDNEDNGNDDDSSDDTITVSPDDKTWTAMLTKKVTIDCIKKSGSDVIMAGSISEDGSSFSTYSVPKKKKKKLKVWRKNKKAATTKNEKRKYSNKIKKTTVAARKKACKKAEPA